MAVKTLEAMLKSGWLTADDRVLSTATWNTPAELTDHLLAVFVAGASLVQVANPDEASLNRRRQTEKITRG